MENLNGFANENNQARRAKPPPRMCPRCTSSNTKFCYYNNNSLSQPRYSCKNCRRHWTHGGTLRNIPIGGRGHKPKRRNVDQSSVSRTVCVQIPPVNHQSFSYVQQNNEFSGSFGASSSSAATVRNLFESLSDNHVVTNVPPIQSFQPMDLLQFSNESFNQDYYDVGSADLNGNPLINQSFGGHVDNYNGYPINQVDQLKWNQSFNNITNMYDNASTSGSRESDMNMNNEDNKTKYNKVIGCPCHLETHGP